MFTNKIYSVLISIKLACRDFNLDSIKIDDFNKSLSLLDDKQKEKLVNVLVKSASDELYSAISTTFVIQNIVQNQEKVEALYFDKVLTLLDSLAHYLQSLNKRIENIEDYTDISNLSKSELKNLIINEEQFYEMSNDEKDDFLKDAFKIFVAIMNKFLRYFMLLKNIEQHDCASKSLRASINYNTTCFIKVLNYRSDDFFALVRSLK